MHPEERRPLRHFNRFTREHQRHQGSHRRDKRADTEHRSDTLHRGYKREHRESEQHRSGHCRPETKERLTGGRKDLCLQGKAMQHHSGDDNKQHPGRHLGAPLPE